MKQKKANGRIGRYIINYKARTFDCLIRRCKDSPGIVIDVITWGIGGGFIDIFEVAEVGVASNNIRCKIAKQETEKVLY